MTTLLRKIKLLLTGVVALSFFMAVTLSSCETKQAGSEDADAVEEAAESDEHPSNDEGGEHPAATDEADSTATEEHPATDTEGDEHPDNQ